MGSCVLIGRLGVAGVRWFGLLFLCCALTPAVFAQDWPDPNPQRQPDGSQLYWCGNNMQWDIQQAIDAASPGDTIVVRGGQYVKSLLVDKPNLTFRPFLGADGEWEPVTFWNPTKGPEAQNGWALKLGPNTWNTTIGRPRQYRQLESGFVAPTTIVPGEYLATPGEAPMEVSRIPGPCFTFRSRSIDNTGVYSDGGKASIEACVFTSGAGFGGGAVLVGEDNATAFVDCEFHDLFANGDTLVIDVPGLDLPNYAISILSSTGTMNPTFSSCLIHDCRGEAILYQVGGTGHWMDCGFENNEALTNFAGTVSIVGAKVDFERTNFTGNLSGFGTVFLNGEGLSPADPLRFEQCEFIGNRTIDGQFGGVLYAIDKKASGQPPRVLFDQCRIEGNNDQAAFVQDDIVSPYFPNYRQGYRNGDPGIPPVRRVSADLNGDGIVNGADLGILFVLWGTDGRP